MKLIQFIHPGPEPVVKVNADGSGCCPWNTSKHKRKFLSVAGEYVDADGQLARSQLVFWGEYEPPTTAEKTGCASSKGMPKWVHTPISPITAEAGINTDPYVFGENFHYACCHQTKRNNNGIRVATAMQKLKRGDIIMFGSNYDGAFHLDTLFVIGKVVGQYSSSDDPIFKDVSETYLNATIRRMFCHTEGTGGCNTGGRDTDDCACPSTLYNAAMFHEDNSDIGGMFSFFPCRSDGQPFERPIISLQNITASPAMQTPKLVCADGSVEVWQNIVGQVRKQNLQLGVYAEEPIIMNQIMPTTEKYNRNC